MTSPVVFNQYQLTDIQVNPQGCLLTFATPNGKQQYQAQHVILATGMESFSEPNIPSFMAEILLLTGSTLTPVVITAGLKG